MRNRTIILTVLLLALVCHGVAFGAEVVSRDELREFNARLLGVTTNHLNQLLGPKGEVRGLKGKSSDAATAGAYYHLYELTGNPKYRAAAMQLVDRIVADMKATKFGVIYIKEKENADGDKVAGGGPPAFGWYTATAAYILGKEGGRDGDLKYIGTVLDKFPWNDKGWWSADIDVNTGISKQPLTKPSPINKNASMVLAAAVASETLKKIDPALSARLKQKADTCLYQQIIPAQEPDGFWHYGLTGKDPKSNDVHGYFMVTMEALIQLRLFTESYRDAAFTNAFEKACGFAQKTLAPLTAPNKGTPQLKWATSSTPKRYVPEDDLKRGFQLTPILMAMGDFREAIKISKLWCQHFPVGNGGTDGSHAVHPSMIMLLQLKQELAKTAN